MERDKPVEQEETVGEAFRRGLRYGARIVLVSHLLLETSFNIDHIAKTGKVECVKPWRQPITCIPDVIKLYQRKFDGGKIEKMVQNIPQSLSREALIQSIEV